MFGLMVRKTVVGGLMAALTLTAGAQSARRTRHESNANRKERIAKTIEDTYSHKWEVFGGGGYLRFRDGDTLRKSNEVNWEVAGNYYLNPATSIVADARGYFGHGNLNNNVYSVYNPLITEYTLMGGVQQRFYRKEKKALSAYVEGGMALGNFDGGSKGIPAANLGMWPTANKPVFSVGVNADYNFYPNLAFRFSPTFVGTTFGSSAGFQSNLGFNFGLVYRFGRQ